MPPASAGRIRRCRSARSSCAARSSASGWKAPHASPAAPSTSASAAATWSATARSCWSRPACSRCRMSRRFRRRCGQRRWGSGSDSSTSPVVRGRGRLFLLPPINPIPIEIHQVLVALERIGEHPVLHEVLEIIELLALAARNAGNAVDDQQVGLLAGEILAHLVEYHLL